MSEMETVVSRLGGDRSSRHVPAFLMAQREARMRKPSPSQHQTKCAPFRLGLRRR
jgi:hypothetical protein